MKQRHFAFSESETSLFHSRISKEGGLHIYDMDLLEHKDTVNELLARYGVKFEFIRITSLRNNSFPSMRFQGSLGSRNLIIWKRDLSRMIDIPYIYDSKECFKESYPFDESNPDSIFSNLNRAYDNAIVLREEIGSEALGKSEKGRAHREYYRPAERGCSG